jgi:hypothetical protein
MVMRLDNLARLMAPRTSQTKSTRPREVFTSTLMASPSINSWCTKQEIAQVNLFIPPLHFLMLLGSYERFLTFSLCNHFYSIALCSEFSPYPFTTLLLFPSPHRIFLCIFLGYFTCASALSSSPEHFPTVSLPSAFRLYIFTTMKRERGKSRRGVLYYITLSRRGILSPSQLALIIARISGPRHNSQGSLMPPLSPPHSIHGNFPAKEEAPPPSECTPFPTSLLPPKNQSTGLGVWRR